MVAVGVVGLAAMGSNLSLNLVGQGHVVAGYDRVAGLAVDLAASETVRKAADGAFVACDTLEDVVAALDPPRVVVLMVPAAGVDPVLEALIPLLDPGDAIVDAGNSRFEDTERRGRAVRGQGIRFVGAGLSGGEEGARTGASIMAGGSAEDWEAVREVLEAASAAVDGTPCCARVGPGGAGHYTKTVHNGIEYSVLQLVSETYDLLRSGLGATPAQVGEAMRTWNGPGTDSYLLDIAVEILEHEDARTGRPFVDVVLDEAGQKGTGAWAAQSALDLGVPATGMAEAALARALSGGRGRREAVRQAFGVPSRAAIKDPTGFSDDVGKALEAATLVAYAQGFDLIRAASDEYGWGVDLAAVARVWQGGCIVRAGLLGPAADALADPGLATLLAAPAVAERVAAGEAAWRRVVSWAALSAVPVPVAGSLLSYLDALRADRLPAALVQAQRDFFGAHTYRRVDADGAFHTRWSGDRTETEA